MPCLHNSPVTAGVESPQSVAQCGVEILRGEPGAGAQTGVPVEPSASAGSVKGGEALG